MMQLLCECLSLVAAVVLASALVRGVLYAFEAGGWYTGTAIACIVAVVCRLVWAAGGLLAERC